MTQQEAARVAQQQAAAAKLPTGMPQRQLSDAERLSTLSLFSSQLHATNSQLSAMPLRIETLSRRRQQQELEQRVTQLEAAIKQFSLATVFVADE